MITSIGGYRLGKEWEKFQKEDRNRKQHNFARFGSIIHHLGKKKSFVQCSIFLHRCKYMIYALITKSVFTHGLLCKVGFLFFQGICDHGICV